MQVAAGRFSCAAAAATAASLAKVIDGRDASGRSALR